jgi:hypothetical protein
MNQKKSKDIANHIVKRLKKIENMNQSNSDFANITVKIKKNQKT